ncbi:MAG: tetratricopeptide repeat protein [Gordonia sp. (in: high G+C Gram-positive bacteria)]|uniref:tetratricopeptide repeat protein n=1 Tax=Gordonia sp. (in: high G+C Gram-positive bacteria) TaxID=84139 RepID=UPI0039E435DF
MSRPVNRQQAAAAARQQQAAVAMSGAVDLSALKARAEAQRAAPAPGAPPSAPAGAGGADAAAPSSGGPVIDVTEATFEAEVINRSMGQLVLVDLWAEWCQPCKQLSPVLESLAAQSGGRWVLAKVDVDANPRIAQAFRAQSIPMVVAIAQGQPVTAFTGAKSEAEIKTWLDDIFKQLGPSFGPAGDAPAEVEQPVDPRMAAAAAKLDEGDVDGALEEYRAIAEAEPDNAEAASLVRNLTFVSRASKHPASIVESAKPGDVDDQLAAADVELFNQKPEEAFDRLVECVRATRDDDRARARARLLELFELYEPNEPVVMAARRKLAQALF